MLPAEPEKDIKTIDFACSACCANAADKRHTHEPQLQMERALAQQAQEQPQGELQGADC